MFICAPLTQPPAPLLPKLARSPLHARPPLRELVHRVRLRATHPTPPLPKLARPPLHARPPLPELTRHVHLLAAHATARPTTAQARAPERLASKRNLACGAGTWPHGCRLVTLNCSTFREFLFI